ncbi:hypothetical protein FMUND_13297 [Fusarium mundagurra]|uniref:DUF6987 domain-containing protein n=1 Tax=Fusarium mundagurra TaxID=1567541 RepID=A0A8H5Y0A5_9HYPO|nr:hypothetical protein FMUND_13297 [Fusarium mundagurra]
MSKTKDSTAITEGQFEDMKRGTASRELQNPVDLESVPRSIAGVVDNSGGALNDASNIIGQTLSLGQEKPGKEKQEEQQEEQSSHDEEYSEHTTQEAENKSGRLGLSSPKDTVDRLTGAVSNTGKPAVGSVIGALGLGGKSDKTPEALKQAEKAIGQMPEAKTKDRKDTSISFEDCDMPTDDKEVVETEVKLKEDTFEEAKDKIFKVDERVDEKDALRVPEGAPQDEAPKLKMSKGKARRPEASDVEVPGGRSSGQEAVRELADVTVTVEADDQIPFKSGQVGEVVKGDPKHSKCSKVDDDGDILDRRGNVIGTPKAWDAPYPGAEQTLEKRLQREQAEQAKVKRTEDVKKDKGLASALAYNIDQTQEKIRPICKMIDDKISASEAQLGDRNSEEQLVRQVRPLIEVGAEILTDINGVIRDLDPDGRIQRNGKQKAAIVEATPEDARRKLESMPHAKKELDPLWALLAATLFQIIAGVELLLDGMFGLIGQLLHGDVISSLTGRKKK